jgi:adenine-specific DNA-methyltransferase
MEDIKLNGQSMDIVCENIQKLKTLFPEVFLEDKIDFEKLQAIIGKYIESNNESYRFTWSGKSNAFRLSQTPSTGTLRPSLKYPDGTDDSKNFDTTQNLYIEGDNLEVLKLLQKSYNNKIKMIYIDPPYNKDKDFVYPDKWSDPIANYKKITGQIDEDGNVTTSDVETEGGKHTKWLNMMYPRLRLARNLITDDGVIFISIDDSEVENLKKVCKEIFGEENFLASVVWQRTYAPISLKKYFSESHEYLLVYAKQKDLFNLNLLPRTEKQNKDYKNPDNDPRGVWKVGNLTVGPAVEKQIYEIVGPTGKSFFPPKGYCWRFTEEKFNEMRQDNRIWFGTAGNNSPVPKLFLTEVQDGVTPMTLWTFQEVGHNQESTRELRDIFEEAVFTNPKPLRYINRILQLGCNKEDIVLDFFSGSSTTAHAILQLNAEDKGNRKFIMVQLPEDLGALLENADSTTKNILQDAILFLDSINKPHSIAEIGKERIRRAGEKIKEELKKKVEEYTNNPRENEQAPMNPDDLDIGFKVFKLDNSNIKKWDVDVGEDFYKVDKKDQNIILREKLGLEIDNFVGGRTELDVVYEIMLKYGLDLTYPLETYNISGKKVYSIGMGAVIVCLEDTINEVLANDIVDLINKLEPNMVRVVIRDLSFVSDDVKTNFKETLRNGVNSYFAKCNNKDDKENQFTFVTI